MSFWSGPKSTWQPPQGWKPYEMITATMGSKPFYGWENPTTKQSVSTTSYGAQFTPPQQAPYMGLPAYGSMPSPFQSPLDRFRDPELQPRRPRPVPMQPGKFTRPWEAQSPRPNQPEFTLPGGGFGVHLGEPFQVNNSTKPAWMKGRLENPNYGGSSLWAGIHGEGSKYQGYLNY